MKSFRDIPIQRKLRAVILLTCTAALVVACGALFGLQFYFFKRDFERDLASVAEIIANNSTAALSFKDETAAREILGALRAKPHIVGAAIVLSNGATLAETGEPLFPFDVPKARLIPGLQEQDGEWLYIWPITLDQEQLGTLILHSDYRAQANKLFRVYAGILVAVLTISFLVAALVSWRLEHLILFPIQSLAQTARTIASRNDYSVRAEKFVEDELGSFTESFNAMLDQIESRDRALRHEIAERTRAEEELQRMQDKLIEASRQAGMAEVATGVLHNVGNVLNSVNVSATLIAEKLHHSKVGNLTRAAGLLREQNGTLAQFLTNDPKGKVLPAYIADVSEHLANERIGALEELELLCKNIEHIKDIVARQQNYARSSGLFELLSLDELIDDAIRMNSDSFERHGMVVERDYEKVPPAALDKHKVLQILINLLRNAKHAVTEAAPPEKRLTVRLRAKENRVAEVRICDNGIGIAPENLTRIFSHGFTTRKEGHGFGLHSA
ncbi:MAG: HAMP domain-containing protein, partial [Verrucomicrobiaceae bacterium]